jgi:excisionase family DNA binding protein
MRRKQSARRTDTTPHVTEGLKRQPLYTVPETAEILNGSEKTVRRLIEKGLLRAVKIEGLVRIDPADLEDLIRDHRSR